MERTTVLEQTNAVEAFQVRIFFKDEVWVAILHSCADNKNLQCINENLGKLLTDVRKSIIKKHADTLPSPSPILGLNGAPVNGYEC